jgi:glycosyltransferase involved in cell wall biosynthesis
MSIALNAVVHNEADRILSLLVHASAYCDELIVVDQESTDNTADLAREFGAVVIPDVCTGWAETSRELAHDNTKADWIAVLDADEVIMSAETLVEFTNQDTYDAATMPRRNYIGGVRYLPDNLDYHMRWFRRGTVYFPTGVHQRVWPNDESKVWATEGTAWILHAKTHAEWELDEERYRTIRAMREAR